MIIDIFFQPFQDFLFMRRAWVACLALSLSGAPLGVMLHLRRLSLLGEALSHGILPGLALGVLWGGMSLPYLLFGGLGVGIILVTLSTWISYQAQAQTESAFSTFYLVSLAMGIILLSGDSGRTRNIFHFLFGNILAVDAVSLYLVVGISILTLIVLAVSYRAWTVEAFDPFFAKQLGLSPFRQQILFLTLVVLNLIIACQALGTLMGLGLIMIPSATAQLLSRRLVLILGLSTIFGSICSYLGLVLSYASNWPAGPTIIGVCGANYVFVFLSVSISRLCRSSLSTRPL